MGGSPDLPYVDPPYTILELTDLADLHPPPVVSHRHFVMRAYLEPFSPLLQDHIFSGANRPFPQPLPILGLHTQADCLSQVINDVNFATRPSRAAVGARLTWSGLRNSHQRGQT